MWTTPKNVFERHTSLNKLSAHQKFYTAAMKETEFSSSICRLAATLKATSVGVPQNEMGKALLNGLPDEYNAIISVLDAVGNEESNLSCEFVKSRIMQEEQRIRMTKKSARKNQKLKFLLLTTACILILITVKTAASLVRSATIVRSLDIMNRWTNFSHLNIPTKKYC